MPTKKDDEISANWAELRAALSTLLAVQETMQSNIQTSIQASIRELGETLTQHLQPRQQAGDQRNEIAEVNPFAPDGNRELIARRPDQRDSRWEAGFKVDIPEFSGGLRGDTLVDWLVTVEEVLDFKQVPNNRRVPLVATKFRGHAASWWQQLKASRNRDNKSPIDSWEKLKKKLKQTFLPHNYDRTMYTRLQNLKQGTRSVDEYAEEFYVLLTRNEINDNEVQLVSRFIGGLRSQLQNALAQFDPTSIAEAHRRAASFEQQQRSGNWSSTSNRGRVQEMNTPKAETATKENTDTATPRPTSVTEDPALRRSSRNALRCFNCGEPGHRQTACPQQTKRGLLVDEQPHVDEPLYDSDEEDRSNNDTVLHHTHGDNGPLLLVGRTCLIPEAKTESWLRTNIFRSTCTIKGRLCTAVCSFIIDSGSSRNVIAEEAVRKLGLPIEAHPAPYNLGWLSDAVNMRVTHRSMVPFSIGPYYKDRMYCDIAPIDVCHLLLGRPWEYDRKITHDGLKNTYRFVWETHQILLMPSREPVAAEPPSTRSVHSRLSFPPTAIDSTQPHPSRSVHSRLTFPQTTSESTLLCSYSVFDQEFRKEGMAYALLPAGTKEQRPTVLSPQFEPILREFADV
ncbi:unnamed protein product, partial [Arabidopsis halleri]